MRNPYKALLVILGLCILVIVIVMAVKTVVLAPRNSPELLEAAKEGAEKK